MLDAILFACLAEGGTAAALAAAYRATGDHTAALVLADWLDEFGRPEWAAAVRQTFSGV